MADRARHTKVDPELTRQLEAAAPEDRSVQAVLYLDPDGASDPESVTRQATSIIESAKRTSGSEPKAVNVMRYLGTVAIDAPASFIQAALDGSGVKSALANVHEAEDPSEDAASVVLD